APVVHGIMQHVDAKLVGLVIHATDVIPERVRRREVRLSRIIALGAKLGLLTRQLRVVFLLRAILRDTALRMERGFLLALREELVVEMTTVVGGATLLVLHSPLSLVIRNFAWCLALASSAAAPSLRVRGTGRNDEKCERRAQRLHALHPVPPFRSVSGRDSRAADSAIQATHMPWRATLIEQRTFFLPETHRSKVCAGA